MKNKKLRSGYTTGACAAAAAKAATLLAMRNVVMSNGNSLIPQSSGITEVEIPFPNDSRVRFYVHQSGITNGHLGLAAYASVIKDAGDDPDITNGAEIVATVQIRNLPDSLDPSLIMHHTSFIIRGGKGVGLVTKPGLSTPVGEAAINPVPRRMIETAVKEAIKELSTAEGGRQKIKDRQLNEVCSMQVEITISVPQGEKLAKKTLNGRLGIAGGISILGTTGIVKPISTEAWTASISASMNVARAAGIDIVVLSAGRTSEVAHMKRYNFSEESYVMMGDYLEFSLLDAKKHGFRRIHLTAQWAKMLKIAMSTPQTHVRHGAINVKKAVSFLQELWQFSFDAGHEFNTAMEIFQRVDASLISRHPLLYSKVCQAAKSYAEKITGDVPVTCFLVSYDGEVIAGSE